MLTLIVYERERRALGSFLAPSARGAASCSSRCRRRRRRPESLPAQLRPPGSASEPPRTVTAGGPGGPGGGDLRGVGLRPRGERSGAAMRPEGPRGAPAAAGRAGRRGRGRAEEEEEEEEATPRGALGRPAASASVEPTARATPARRAAGMGGHGRNGGRASSARREGLRRPRGLGAQEPGHVGTAPRAAGDPCRGPPATSYQSRHGFTGSPGLPGGKCASGWEDGGASRLHQQGCKGLTRAKRSA